MSSDGPARRPRPDPVLSDHVRTRLDALLAEAPPRRALPPPTDPDATVVRWVPVVEESTPPQAEPIQATGPVIAAVATRFTRRHLMVVAMMLALGVLVALYALSRARAIPLEPVEVQTAAVAPPPPSAAPAASPAPPPSVQVHVVGAVVRPGVVVLPPGSRVRDALEAAGGVTSQARPGDLNLAAPVADGAQIVVGDLRRPGGQVRGGDQAPPAGAPGPGARPSAGGAAAKLNLNAATEAQLDALPGVGPVTAQKIVAWRTEHQRFSKVAELQEVPGIGPKTYAELEPLVTV